MKKKRFTLEQILIILELKRDGIKLSDICQQYKFSKQTYYRWQAKYGWMIEADATTPKSIDDAKHPSAEVYQPPGRKH